MDRKPELIILTALVFASMATLIVLDERHNSPKRENINTNFTPINISIEPQECMWDNTTYSKAMLPALDDSFSARWTAYYHVTNISRCGVWNEFDAVNTQNEKIHVRTTAEFLYYETSMGSNISTVSDM